MYSTSNAAAYYAASILAAVAMARVSFNTVRTPLLETAVCRTYYSAHDQGRLRGEQPSEQQCKISPVQQELASFLGWTEFWMLLPAFLLIVPYAHLITVVSKRAVLLANAFSAFLSVTFFVLIANASTTFDIRLIWVCKLFDVIGGGQAVQTSLLYTVLAEETDQERLSRVYYAVASATLVAEILGSLLVGVLLKFGTWIASIFIIGAFALPIIPSWILFRTEIIAQLETLSPVGSHGGISRSNSINSESPLQYTQQSRSDNHRATWLIKSLLAICTLFHVYVKSTISMHSGNNALSTSTVLFFVFMLGIQIRLVFQQTASTVFGWTMADTSFLITLQSLVCATVLSLLPKISLYLLRSAHTLTQHIDLNVSKFSALLFACGTLLMGSAPSSNVFVVAALLFSTGCGMYDSLKSYVTKSLGKEQVPHYYLFLSVVETLGHLMGSKIWTTLLRVGLQMGGMWQGLPYYVCSVNFLLTFMILRRLRGASPSLADQDGAT